MMYTIENDSRGYWVWRGEPGWGKVLTLHFTFWGAERMVRRLKMIDEWNSGQQK